MKDDTWVDIPANSSEDELYFVINIGDMLDKLTQGRYLSNPHRVLNASGRHRMSYPYFLEPSWDAEVVPLPLKAEVDPENQTHRLRWDD